MGAAMSSTRSVSSRGMSSKYGKVVPFALLLFLKTRPLLRLKLPPVASGGMYELRPTVYFG